MKPQVTVARPVMRHSTHLHVNLSTLESNINKIRRLAPRAELIPMVKGNAYGHGIIPVSQFLTREMNQRRLGVASLGEALEIIRAIPEFQGSMNPNNSRHHGSSGGGSSKNVISSASGTTIRRRTDRDIVVFSDTELLSPKLRCLYRHLPLHPMLCSVEDVRRFVADAELRHHPVFLKVNTGMNRLGVTREEVAQEIIPLLKQRGITSVQHVAQHFATSGQWFRKLDRADRQLRNFHETVALLRDSGIRVEETSVANSGAIEQNIGVEESFVRPGLMMYGPPSVLAPRRVWTGKQVSEFVTHVIKTFVVRSGECIGYGFHAVEEDCVVAILGIGYADGFLRYHTGMAVEINGLVGKVHGIVNMDMTAVTFPLSHHHPKVAETQLLQRVRQGTRVRVWGDDITTRALFAKTNTYELMCAVSVRVPRVYTYGAKGTHTKGARIAKKKQK